MKLLAGSFLSLLQLNVIALKTIHCYLNYCSTSDICEYDPDTNHYDCWTADEYNLYNIILQSTSQNHVVHVTSRHYKPDKCTNKFIRWSGENNVNTVNQCSQIKQWKTCVLYSRQQSRRESKFHG